MDGGPTTWRLSLVRGRSGLPKEEFLSHWTGPHRDHIAALDGVQATRFFVVESWTPSGPGWDGLGLIRFSSRAAGEATFDDPALRSWIAAERSAHFDAVENAWLRAVDVGSHDDLR